MKTKNLEKILNLIRESMMTTGSTTGKPGFSSKADADGPTAGFDPVIGKVMKRKKYLSLGPGSRKRWMKKDESK